MDSQQARVSFANGRVDLVIAPAGDSPALTLTSACTGLVPASGIASFSPDWQALDVLPISGEDRCGSYKGLRIVSACDSNLQVEWNGVVYQQQPVAAVWMSVTNTASQDQYLLRLFALHADPRAGSTVHAALDPEHALILNNGLWMDTPQSTWRVPTPLDEFHQGYWSIGLGQPGGNAIVAGIGEPASACASIGFLRHQNQLGLELGGWLWADTHERPLRLRPGQTFHLQRMLILTATDLHRGLIQYAGLVQRYIDRPLHFPPYAGIFSAYGSDPTGQHPEHHPLTEQRIQTMRTVVDTYLKPYGLDTFKTQFAGLSSGPPGMVGRRCEWTNLDIAPSSDGLVDRIYEAGFTPDVYDSHRDFPRGIEAHVRDLRQHGYRPALVCRPFLNIRSGPPEYDQLAADVFAMAVKRWGYEYLMFDFNSDDYESADDTHTMAQGIRSRFQAVRDCVGPKVFIEACMVSPGPVLGIADGFRHACDWRGGIETQLVRQACTRYYYHQRWFQLDHEFFDPQLFPFTWVDQGELGMAASLDRVRMWTSFGALTGFSWLTGGVVENVSPARWGIFTRALPVYGPCARPVDLLQNDPPSIWLLDAQAAGQPHQVLGLFNWAQQPRTLSLAPADIGIDPGDHLWFDFWEQRLLGPSHAVDVELPPYSCKVFIITAAHAQPTWVGTDRHVTGAIGLEHFSYDPLTDKLSGECSGPAGTRQHHYVYLPPALTPVSGAGASFELPQHRLMQVIVAVDASGRKAWHIQLQRGRHIL
ncbi:MAG: hypothetical protein M1546_12005 [Chloroflexi bacterium]|nr:hypothetical protein [Chloroflexota bacterium]